MPCSMGAGIVVAVEDSSCTGNAAPWACFSLVRVEKDVIRQLGGTLGGVRARRSDAVRSRCPSKAKASSEEGGGSRKVISGGGWFE